MRQRLEGGVGRRQPHGCAIDEMTQHIDQVADEMDFTKQSENG